MAQLDNAIYPTVKPPAEICPTNNFPSTQRKLSNAVKGKVERKQSISKNILDRKIEQAKFEKKELEANIHQLETQCRELKDQYVRCESDNAIQQSRLQKQIEEFKAKVDQIQDQNQKIEARLCKKKQKVAQLKAHAMQAEENLQIGVEARERQIVDGITSQMQSKIDHLNTKLASKRAKNEDLKTKIKNINEVMGGLRQQLHDKETEIGSLNNKIAYCIEQKETTHGKLESLKLKFRSLEEQMRCMHANSTLESEDSSSCQGHYVTVINQLKSKMSQLETKLQDKKKKIDTLQQQNDALTSHNARQTQQCDRKGGEIDHLKVRLHDVEAQVREWKTKLAQLYTQKSDEQAIIHQKDMEITMGKERFRALELNSKKQIQELQLQLKTLRSEFERETLQLQESSACSDSKIVGLSKELETLKHMLELASASQQELETKLSDSETRVKTAHEQLETLGNDYQKDKRETIAIKSALESVNVERKQYQQRILELREELLGQESLKEGFKALQDELQSSKTQVFQALQLSNKLSEDKESMQRQLNANVTELTQRLERKETQHHKLVQETNDLFTQRKNHEDKITLLKEEIAQLKEQNCLIQTKAEHLEMDKIEFEKLCSQHFEKGERISFNQLFEEFRDTKRALKTAQTRIETLRNEIESNTKLEIQCRERHVQDAVRETRQEFEHQAEAMEKRHEAIKKEVMQRDKQIDKAQERIQELHTRLEQSVGEPKKWQKSLNEQSREIEMLKQQCNKLRRENIEVSSLRDMLRSSREECQRKSQQLRLMHSKFAVMRRDVLSTKRDNEETSSGTTKKDKLPVRASHVPTTK